MKIGQRELLLSYVPKLNDCLSVLPDEMIHSNSLCRKYIAKINQRLALCNLKPRIASWRYNRGNRFLNRNIGKKNHIFLNDSSIEISSLQHTQEIPEIIQVDDSVQEIVGSLIDGLQDRDTIVRWSCAKGIGRIAERLPRDFAEEVIDGILSLFGENLLYRTVSDTLIASIDAVSDSTWHGACLALAEFARRGLLLPEKLDVAIPWVKMVTTDFFFYLK